MSDSVDRFDQRVDAAVERVRSPVLDRVFYPLSTAADHSMVWFALGAARSIRTGDTRFALRYGAAMGFESALTNGPIKAIFRRSRPRPDTDDGPLPYGLRRPITSSFPSGHATAAFTAVTLLAGPGRRGPWWVLATLVAGSRVYVRMHHASDVVGGAALGLILGRVLSRWVGEPTR
ncbi:MAG: phosphatase PAP2 family protein [Acidimicrobiia bacterium]|nr:phosphatase PAP2 family protein [Acidimicrobiia bacterium]